MPPPASPPRAPWLPLIGMLLVVAATAGAFWLMRSEREASGWVSHSIRAQLAIARFEEQLVRFESAYRGYMIRPLPVLLDDVADARRLAGEQFDVLTRETADNPIQRAHVARLRLLFDEKVAIGLRWTRRQQDGRMSDALVRFGNQRGRIVTNMIRAEAMAMTAEEDRLLAERQVQARRLASAIGVGLLILVVLILLAALLMVRDADLRTRETRAALDEALAAERRAVAAGSAREAAEDMVRQMQKMEAVGQLTGGIAHDFNNMLAIVIGSLDLAARRMNEPDGLRRALANAREGAERAATLTARLLAFSRQSPLAPVAVNVNRLVSGMSDLLRRTLGEDIEIETVLAGGLWATFADPGEVENALINLAVNARDAMASRPVARLTIETANAHFDDATAAERAELRPGQYVMIAVSDTGAGMAAETIARAFDPFFTTKSVGKGTGLGLSQVFGFAKQSGGHVAIYSEPDQGTTVKLYLPRLQGAEATMVDATLPADADGASLPAGRADRIVLVCEDEGGVRHYSVDALRELGYTALSASDGDEALRLLAGNPDIALLFTDIVMPGMSGRVLADRARRIRPSLKVLYMTGYTRNAVVHNGVLDPGVAFLAKPFTVSQLARKVRDVLDGGGINRPA